MTLCSHRREETSNAAGKPSTSMPPTDPPYTFPAPSGTHPRHRFFMLPRAHMSTKKCPAVFSIHPPLVGQQGRQGWSVRGGGGGKGNRLLALRSRLKFVAWIFMGQKKWRGAMLHPRSLPLCARTCVCMCVLFIRMCESDWQK